MTTHPSFRRRARAACALVLTISLVAGAGCSDDPPEPEADGTSTTVAATGGTGRLVAPARTEFATDAGPVTLACEGSGAVPVVLVAGTDDPIARWDDLVEDAGQEVLLCRFDPSRATALPITPTTRADALASALTQSGLPSPYVVVAHAVGGLSARRFGADHADLLGAALLLDPTTPEGLASQHDALSAEGWDVDATQADAEAPATWSDVPLQVLSHDPASEVLGPDPEAEARWTEGQREYAALSPSGRFEQVEGAGSYVDRDDPQRVIRAIDDLSRLAVSASDGGDTDEAFTPVLSPWECPDNAPDAARCNRVETPADWNDPSGPTVSLPVIVIPATGDEREPDPLVVPAGGPGGSMTVVAQYWSDPHRDIVLYDQRGTGAAEPDLDCPERNEAWVANFRRDESFETERAAIIDAYERCRTRLEADGVDLDDYDTLANVRDLDAIRTALGYDEWNILGISYAARLALAAMRATPTAIRSVMLDSVDDVTTGGLAASVGSAERAIAELVTACSAAATCAAKHPDLAAEIREVEARYNASPIRAEVDLGDGNGPTTFVITGYDVMAGFFQAMYDAALIPLLPGIIGDLADGNTAVIGSLVTQAVTQASTVAWGMHLSVNCADQAGLDLEADEDEVADPGRFRLLATEPLCDDWPVEPTSDTFDTPVSSDIPTLVIAGRFDPITPPAGSEAVAARLANSTFAVWPDRGHVVTGEPCAETVLSAFLDDPAAAVDLTCVDAVPDPAFG